MVAANSGFKDAPQAAQKALVSGISARQEGQEIIREHYKDPAEKYRSSAIPNKALSHLLDRCETVVMILASIRETYEQETVKLVQRYNADKLPLRLQHAANQLNLLPTKELRLHLCFHSVDDETRKDY